MYLFISMSAAFSFAIGGIFMQLSEGFSKPLPSLLVYICFGIGASLQIYATNASSVGITYILVLGLEAIMVFLISNFIFKEPYSLLKVAGIILVVIGVVFLRAEK
jgi:multidrug transporter EmrE-like cation transporter